MDDLIKKIKSFFKTKEEPKDGFSQQEREAIVDLLTLIEFSDNDIQVEENEKVERNIEALCWDSGTSLENYHKSSIGKIRTALADETKLDKLFTSIKSRFSTVQNLDRAIDIGKSVAYVDGINVKEKDFLKEVEARLKS